MKYYISYLSHNKADYITSQRLQMASNTAREDTVRPG